MQSILFLKRDEIDIEKWNDCIQQSPNALIYAYSFYLDCMHQNWCALTGDDYGWVMPVIFKCKWGINYLFQPPFTQQLGIYFKTQTHVPYTEIFKWLRNKYSFWEISCDANTATHLQSDIIEKTAATNFVLDLHRSYALIAQYYHQDLIKNLKKSNQQKLHYQTSTDYRYSIQLYVKHYAGRTPHIKHYHFEQFTKLCNYAFSHQQLYCRNTVNDKGDILSSAILLTDGKRLYNIMNTTTDEGRKVSSNHFLLDAIIREFSGKQLLFDFEGSDLPGVKSFYENYGGKNEPYFQIRYNQLIWPLKMIKG